MRAGQRPSVSQRSCISCAVFMAKARARSSECSRACIPSHQNSSAAIGNATSRQNLGRTPSANRNAVSNKITMLQTRATISRQQVQMPAEIDGHEDQGAGCNRKQPALTVGEIQPCPALRNRHRRRPWLRRFVLHRNASVASTSAAAFSGSNAECPLLGLMTSFACGQALCRSQAFCSGQTTS